MHWSCKRLNDRAHREYNNAQVFMRGRRHCVGIDDASFFSFHCIVLVCERSRMGVRSHTLYTVKEPYQYSTSIK